VYPRSEFPVEGQDPAQRTGFPVEDETIPLNGNGTLNLAYYRLRNGDG